VKYDLLAACSKKCSINPGSLPGGVGELIHRWFEEGANRETIIARARELGVKVTSGSLQRHKANHLLPARDPHSPLNDGDDDPSRKFSELEVIDSVIQRFARQMQKGSQQVTTEQGLRAIELKHKLTEGSVFDALFDALSGNDDEDMSDLGPAAPDGFATLDEFVTEGDDPPLEPPITGV
jgi:hypothetical protein